MAPLGLTWFNFIVWLVSVPGMIIISWIIPKTKWWKKIMDEYFSWNTK